MSRERHFFYNCAASWIKYKTLFPPRRQRQFQFDQNAKNTFLYVSFSCSSPPCPCRITHSLLLEKCYMLTFQTAKVQQRHCTSLLSPLLPRVRVRCPRLRSALTFSPGTIPRPGRTFYGERLAGKGSDGGIGAVGEVTAKLVSGNRHHAYSLNSAAFGIIVIPSLAEGSSPPYKSLHTSLDPARCRLIAIYGCPNAHL